MPSLIHILTAFAVAAVVEAQSVSTCPKFHIIVARGSNENATSELNEGSMIATSNATCALIAGCTHYGIPYPAIADGSVVDYNKSESAGIKAMRDAITTFHDSCPKTPMAVMGYSQGAQVVSDTLCGRSEKYYFGNTPALTGPAADMIIATILFADLAYVAAQLPYNIGTANATEHGAFPRHNLTGCYPFNSTLRTYCDHGDAWCANAGTSPGAIAIHEGYVKKYTEPASKWVAYKYKQWIAAQ